MRRLAIVGAGPAGLAAAWKLKDAPLEITLFEKSRGVFGRATSRTRHGVRMDPGANYFRIPAEGELHALVQETLPTDDLVEIPGDVWTFDTHGQIQPGDPAQNQEPKWTYRSGISTLGKLLVDQFDGDLSLQARVTSLQKSGEGWRLTEASGEELGWFDDVLLTAPAPQLVELLDRSGVGKSTPWKTALEEVSYARQFCFMLGFEGKFDRPGEFFALINGDREHDISWLSFENDKPGRVPEGQTVVVVQMSPAWTAKNFEVPVDQLHPEVIQQASQLLRLGGAQPAWIESQRWKFSLPQSAANREALRAAEADHLWFAGDYLVGKGRVEGALQEGLSVAERITQAV